MIDRPTCDFCPLVRNCPHDCRYQGGAVAQGTLELQKEENDE